MSFSDWLPHITRLCDEIRLRTRDALSDAIRTGDPELSRPLKRGAGDFTYGLDLPSEDCLRAWHGARAREGPLSVMTEDSGWRHLGPGPKGEVVELPGFDHGGPRIGFDPVDGTRNLMADLRSAWTVVSFAPAGTGEPRLGELSGGMIAEIPTTRAARFRRFFSDGDTTWLEEGALGGASEEESPPIGPARVVRTDGDDRPDHGYFPFFRYDPLQRLVIAEWEARFFERLERNENAEMHTIYNDQYCSSGGQLVELMSGTYRMIVDARALAARRSGTNQIFTKPYDIGGAIVCARAAGCELTDAEGNALDFPLDVTTPVDFCGYVNAPTRLRLEPHWLAVVR